MTLFRLEGIGGGVFFRFPFTKEEAGAIVKHVAVCLFLTASDDSVWCGLNVIRNGEHNLKGESGLKLLLLGLASERTFTSSGVVLFLLVWPVVMLMVGGRLGEENKLTSLK